MFMRRIAIYGKGGIGKSTTTSNLSAALSTMGYKVMQVGCDPKSDSVKNLMGGKKIVTVLDRLREDEEAELHLDDIVFKGFNDILCVEAGGPTPGIGCAGRGIITAFDKLEELGAYTTYRPDIVFYDVLGDVVCGGLALPGNRPADGLLQPTFRIHIHKHLRRANIRHLSAHQKRVKFLLHRIRLCNISRD